MLMTVNNEKHYKFAKRMQLKLLKLGIRVRLDDSDNRISKKIRDAQIHKIPYQIVIGDNELNSKDIVYREYGKNEEVKIPLTKFISLLKKKIKNRIK